MPFNSSLPADHAQIVAAELRDQFNGLKASIDAQSAQIAVLQNQINTQQAHWDTLANQLAVLFPLNIGMDDPLTQYEVVRIAAQADTFLAALIAA